MGNSLKPIEFMIAVTIAGTIFAIAYQSYVTLIPSLPIQWDFVVIAGIVGWVFGALALLLPKNDDWTIEELYAQLDQTVRYLNETLEENYNLRETVKEYKQKCLSDAAKLIAKNTGNARKTRTRNTK